MKSREDMLLEIRTKVAEKYGIDIAVIKDDGDYFNAQEIKADVKTSADKIFVLIDADTDVGPRIGADIMRDKITKECAWNKEGPTTRQLFAENPGPTEESLSEKASKIAKGLGASHVEIAEVNAYITSCRLVAYMPSDTKVTAKNYVMFKDGDVIKYKEIV